MKKPFFKCTVAIATAMMIAIHAAASRESAPVKSATAPSDSPRIAASASGTGMPPFTVNEVSVAENPAPPNHPKTFCAPCADITAPSASRATVGA
jgi:hypothetical protein